MAKCALGAAVVLFSFIGGSCGDEGAERYPYICANGTVALGTTSRPDTTQCTACDSGYRLKERACAANTYACINGTAAAGTPEDDSAPQCVACNPGYHLQDTTCVANRYACANGRARDGQPLASDASGCVACDSGYHLAESAAGSICDPNAYACVNGTPVAGQPTVDGENRCVECDSYYHLGAQEECVENTYTCDNGMARNGRPAAYGDQQFCVSCDTAGYNVYVDGVTGSQICGGNDYICFNGDAVDEVAPNRGAERCEGCDTGYRLSNERCITHTYTCPYGRAARGIPAIDKEIRCTACDTNYRLAGTDCIPEYENVLELAAIGDTLYMTGDRFDTLYTVDTATARPKAVNPALGPGFGVGESTPTGLAAIGDTLYMVGESQSRLYTLDAATGMATAVGTAHQFGVDEPAPQGLSAVGGALYMLCDSEPYHGQANRLYTVDIATGVASLVGDLLNHDDSIAVYDILRPRGLAAIGDTLYLVDGSITRLLIVDTATATVKSVPRPWRESGLGAQGFNVEEFYPTGLAAIGDTLYMGSYYSRLYTLDSATGEAALVGTVGIDTPY